MRRRDGEFTRSETKEFHGSHEERGQSWPRDVPRHVGSPNEEGFGQDWPSDVPGSASQPLVEDRAHRWFGNVAQGSDIATGRRRASRRSVRTANRSGRMRRWLSRFMELIRRRSR
jgi:hypothetical protein